MRASSTCLPLTLGQPLGNRLVAHARRSSLAAVVAQGGHSLPLTRAILGRRAGGSDGGGVRGKVCAFCVCASH